MDLSNVDVEKICDIIEEISSIITNINNEIDEMNNSCSSLKQECNLLNDYNGQEVVGSKIQKQVMKEHEGEQIYSHTEVTWKEWNISGCDTIISKSETIIKMIMDIESAVQNVATLLISSQLSTETIESYISGLNDIMGELSPEQRQILLDTFKNYTAEDEYSAMNGNYIGVKPENEQWWTNDAMYAKYDATTGAVLVYQIVNGKEVGMGWIPADKWIEGASAAVGIPITDVQNKNSDTLTNEQKAIDSLKKVGNLIGSTAMVVGKSLFGSSFENFSDNSDIISNTVVNSFDKNVNINTDNIKDGTKVADAYKKYSSELTNAKYATVDENIFTTTTEDSINGQPVLVTHVVVNNPKQVSGYAANGKYGNGGQTVTDMVSDVQKSGENPVVAIFGSHYTSGGNQDQTGNASNTNGVIILNGQILKDGVTKGNELQLYSDGTINTSSGQSAQELVNNGVKNTFTAHSVPAIIDGSTARSYEETNLYKRNVLGSTNTGEYYIVTDLTYNNALSDTAEYLKSKGCVEAQSLDQGGSVELVINGKIINDISGNIGSDGTNDAGERYGADMIYFTS